MKHMMRWLGRFENNYKDLRPKPIQFMTVNGTAARVRSFPQYVDGIKLYCMEDTREGKAVVLVVMVEDIKLSTPIAINNAKHTDGKGIGPQGCSFGDDAARNLLADVIAKNDAQAEVLSEIYAKYFGTSGADKQKMEHDYVPPPFYLPTRADCENAYRKLVEEGEELSTSRLLEEVRTNLEGLDKPLDPQWESVTKEELARWFRQQE